MPINVLIVDDISETRMEYRYFIYAKKPLIPIICREVPRLPFELSGIQYILYDDFEALTHVLKAYQ